MTNKESNMPEVIWANCVDCQEITTQDYKGKNQHDGDYIYICRRCGCENSIIDKEDELKR